MGQLFSMPSTTASSTSTPINETVRIGIGPSKNVFTVQKHLTQDSEFFDAILRHKSRETAEGVVRLPEVHAETFGVYIQWLQTGTIKYPDSRSVERTDEDSFTRYGEPVQEDPSLHPKWRYSDTTIRAPPDLDDSGDYEILTRAIILSDVIADNKFRWAVRRAAFTRSKSGKEKFPSPEVVADIYHNSKPKSLTRMVMVRAYKPWEWSPMEGSAWPEYKEIMGLFPEEFKQDMEGCWAQDYIQTLKKRYGH